MIAYFFTLSAPPNFFMHDVKPFWLKSKDEELEHFRALENERRQHESTEGERQKGAV